MICPTSENTSSTSAAEAPATKGKRKARKAKPANKAGRAKKAAGKPKADRANKKAEVIAMMRRADPKASNLCSRLASSVGDQSYNVLCFGVP